MEDGKWKAAVMDAPSSMITSQIEGFSSSDDDDDGDRRIAVTRTFSSSAWPIEPLPAIGTLLLSQYQ